MQSHTFINTGNNVIKSLQPGPPLLSSLMGQNQRFTTTFQLVNIY